MRPVIFSLLCCVSVIWGSGDAAAQSPGATDSDKPSQPAAKTPPAPARPAETATPGQAKVAPGAEAEPETPTRQPPASAPRPDPSLSHRYQLGLGLRVGTGYRVIAPYEDGQFCGDAKKRVCGARQPVWLEISPSFGVTQSLELLVDLRLFLEDDFATTKGFFISPGIKYYASDGWFKFFASGQVVFDYQEMEGTEDLRNAGLSNFDFAIRSALGVHFDVHRNVGLFVQGGVILGFVRWLTFTVDGAAGVQVRY